MELLEQQELLEVQLRCFVQRRHQRWYHSCCNRRLQLELLRNHKLVLELRNRKLVLVHSKTIGERGA